MIFETVKGDDKINGNIDLDFMKIAG